MADPVLSYKKPQRGKAEPAEEVPSTEPTQRKVLARRKALQDFYHIQKKKELERQKQTQATTDPDPQTDTQDDSIIQETSQNPELEPSISLPNLDDPESFDRFVKETPMKSILHLRNSITNELNSRELEKKSIIYDNYYELIKLNQTLKNLSTPTVSKLPDTFTGLKEMERTETVDKTYIIDTLGDLKDFLDKKASVYDDTFPNIIATLQNDYHTDSESVSSVKGVVETDPVTIPDSVDREALAQEADFLLSSLEGADDKRKEEIKKQLRAIREGLDPQQDQLLVLQLGQLLA